MGQYVAQMQRPISVPDGTARLFDLIEPRSPDLMPAFYMAVRDTLVAPDLETAVRIAYEGDRAVWRVVTLDGEVCSSFADAAPPLTRDVLLLLSCVHVCVVGAFRQFDRHQWCNERRWQGAAHRRNDFVQRTHSPSR